MVAVLRSLDAERAQVCITKPVGAARSCGLPDRLPSRCIAGGKGIARRLLDEVVVRYRFLRPLRSR
jgi:hypothetical protein